MATWIAYLPAVHGGFIWDDEGHVTKPELRSLHGLFRIWFEVGATQQYYPLLHTAFWIEHHLWGDQVIGYHLVNIALHAGAALMVMVIFRGLLRSKKVAWADSAAVLTAAVFALHPVHVESVAWITEQKNTLSAVFYLAAMWTYLRFDQTRSLRMYVLASVIFVACLLTKTVTASLPAALLVIFWWQRGKLSLRRDGVPLIPWFLLGAVGGLFTAWVEHNLIGAKGQAFEFSALQRFLLAGRVVWFYLHKLVWPAELIFIYPRWNVNSSVGWQWLFPSALIALFAVLLAGSRKNRAPLAAMLFFVGSLFPVLGFFNVFPFLYSFVADHFQYLPSLGVIALVCAALTAALTRASGRAVRVALPLLPILLGVLTFRQCRMYADLQTLYETTIQRNPACWMAYNNLGLVLGAKGRYDDAIAAHRQALALRPVNPEALGNLATALRKTGRLQEAVDCLQEALTMNPANADEMFSNLGGALNAMGRYDEAIAAYQESLRLKPDAPDVLGNLVLPLTNAGRLQEAIDRSAEALRLDPDNPRIHIYLGIALNKAGRLPEAVNEYQQAIRLQPDFFEAQWNLAMACDALGRFPEALNAAERALELARSSGRADLVQRIDSWIASCRARAGKTTSGSSPK